MLIPEPTPGDTKWFVRDRFGLFIHWGLYALPARHEWVRHNEQLTDADYDVFFRHFDPDLYDPDQWAKAAADAGMKYFVITTKHHDGFCLWDSKLTDYKSTNTPARRDLLLPMIAAFRNRGIRVGLYHSLIDWHHPDFVIDPHVGPLRNSPDREKLNSGRDQKKYAEYLHAQVRELLTEFGPIDILWLDFSYPKPDGTGKGKADWDSENLYKLIRELQPDIILNDRLDLPGGWDIKTPEQFQPQQRVHVDGKPVVWEACQTFSGSWGYHRDETSWKSLDQLLLMLVDTVSKGGNLLLNVGPTGRGEIDQRALERLAGLGKWMHHHGRSIYGCTQAPAEFKTPADCRLTYNPATRRMYIHILAWPFVELHLDGFAGKIEYAQLLNDASQVKVEGKPDWQTHFSGDQSPGWTTLRLPVQKPDVALPVVEIFLK
jgi:alpha-L-fucosidase